MFTGDIQLILQTVIELTTKAGMFKSVGATKVTIMDLTAIAILMLSAMEKK